MPVIQGSNNFSIGGNANLTEVHGDATIIRFDGPYTENEREQISEYIAHFTVLPDVKDKITKHSLTQSIITLPRAQAALNDYETKKRSGPCLKGTREGLLREMAEWATCLSESKIYVLSGLAGTGKSTIAYTIASRADDIGLLGASFFFSRDEADRKNAKKFFTTLAFQLCVYDERFSRAIGNVLLTERGSAATTKGPQEQLQALILEPLQTIVTSLVRPILLVVDALDECDEEDSTGLIMALGQLVRDLPSFKVILTTRPQQTFSHLGNQDDHKIFRLQDIEEKVVDGDIRLYLKQSLSLEEVRARLGDPDEEWQASDEQIESLVRAAGRLFVIASTAVLYILDKFASDPEAQIATLLRALAQDHMPLKGLNHFYTVILRNAMPEDCDNADIVERYQAVVGTIVLLQTPLSITTLACLINKRAKQIQIVLRKLQSIILLGSDNIPVIYHKSFPDYVTDPARCKDVHLHIDPMSQHTQIVMHCFRIMNMYLKYNMLKLGDPARFMNNKDGLALQGISDKKLQEMISLEVQYATVYWANHFKNAITTNADLIVALDAFANKHLLHWFETLSLIGRLDSAHQALSTVLKLLSTSSELYQLLFDGLRFILRFYELIERSALHMYYSALPFTPTDCRLYQQYNVETQHNLCRVRGGPETWDALLTNLTVGPAIRGITFSLDSTMFAVWDWKTLRCWEAATGAPVGTITGGFFAIASDLSTVASSNDSTVTLYNVKTSIPIATFTTPGKVYRLAISSDGSRIAAGLSDGTVGLWKMGENDPICCHNDFRYDGSTPLTFSPTGAILAYLSVGSGIKLRDGMNGRFIADLDNISGVPKEFLFSLNNSRIAALSNNGTLTLWKSDRGQLVGASKDAASGRALAISAHGSLLATLFNKTVKIWEGSSDPLQLVESLDFDSGKFINVLEFYTANVLAIAEYRGILFYDIKNRWFILTLPCFRPMALAFSPDRSRFSAGTFDDSTVYLWDVQDISTSGSCPNKPSHVSALALSHDCSQLACKYGDGTLEVWETRATKRLVTTHRGKKALMTDLAFSPGGRIFASGSAEDGITVWDNEDAAPSGMIEHPTSSGRVRAMAMSSHMLAAADEEGIKLWDPKTLENLGTIEEYNSTLLMFSPRGTLLASYNGWVNKKRVAISDVVKRTTIAKFNVDKLIFAMAFLPDDSHLVVQFKSGEFRSFNILDKNVIEGARLEHLRQLPNVPLWHDIPVWLGRNCEQVAGLFPQHPEPVPVLWIPSDLGIEMRAPYRRVAFQGSSMIALGCSDGRVILLY